MKILAEAKKDFDVTAAIADFIAEEKARHNGKMSQGCDIRTGDIFLALADRYSDVTFLLLDDEEKIIGWRN